MADLPDPGGLCGIPIPPPWCLLDDAAGEVAGAAAEQLGGVRRDVIRPRRQTGHAVVTHQVLADFHVVVGGCVQERDVPALEAIAPGVAQQRERRAGQAISGHERAVAQLTTRSEMWSR